MNRQTADPITTADAAATRTSTRGSTAAEKKVPVSPVVSCADKQSVGGHTSGTSSSSLSLRADWQNVAAMMSKQRRPAATTSSDITSTAPASSEAPSLDAVRSTHRHKKNKSKTRNTATHARATSTEASMVKLAAVEGSARQRLRSCSPAAVGPTPLPCGAPRHGWEDLPQHMWGLRESAATARFHASAMPTKETSPVPHRPATAGEATARHVEASLRTVAAKDVKGEEDWGGGALCGVRQRSHRRGTSPQPIPAAPFSTVPKAVGRSYTSISPSVARPEHADMAGAGLLRRHSSDSPDVRPLTVPLGKPADASDDDKAGPKDPMGRAIGAGQPASPSVARLSPSLAAPSFARLGTHSPSPCPMRPGRHHRVPLATTAETGTQAGSASASAVAVPMLPGSSSRSFSAKDGQRTASAVALSVRSHTGNDGGRHASSPAPRLRTTEASVDTLAEWNEKENHAPAARPLPSMRPLPVATAVVEKDKGTVQPQRPRQAMAALPSPMMVAACVRREAATGHRSASASPTSSMPTSSFSSSSTSPSDTASSTSTAQLASMRRSRSRSPQPRSAPPPVTSTSGFLSDSSLASTAPRAAEKEITAAFPATAAQPETQPFLPSAASLATVPQMPLTSTATDRLRLVLQGPLARVAVALSLVPAHCLAAGLDVSHSLTGACRFDLAWTVVNVCLANWNGSPFFMAFTRLLVMLACMALFTVVVVYGVGRLLGYGLLRLPCFGAQTLGQRAFLLRELHFPHPSQALLPSTGAGDVRMVGVHEADTTTATTPLSSLSTSLEDGEVTNKEAAGMGRLIRGNAVCLRIRKWWGTRARPVLTGSACVGLGVHKADIFLIPWGLVSGLAIAAPIYNALLHRFWPGQAHWAAMTPYLAPDAVFSLDASMLLWAVTLLLDWWLVCGLLDVMYQQAALSIALPHASFGNFAAAADTRYFPSWLDANKVLAVAEREDDRGQGLQGKKKTPPSHSVGSDEATQKRGRAWVVRYADAAIARLLTQPRRPPTRWLAACVDDGQRPAHTTVALAKGSDTKQMTRRRLPTLNAFRLLFFWALLLAGWLLVAVAFVLAGLLVSGGRTASERRLAAYAQRANMLVSGTATETGGTLTHATVARALLAILFASLATALAFVAALQDWGWPALEPHPHLALPGRPSAVCGPCLHTMTVHGQGAASDPPRASSSTATATTAEATRRMPTGASTGWHMLTLLSVVVALSVRLMVENARALFVFIPPSSPAGVRVGAVVLMLPAIVAALGFFAALLSTSLHFVGKRGEQHHLDAPSASSGAGLTLPAPTRLADLWRAWVVGLHTAARPAPAALAALFFLCPQLPQFTVLQSLPVDAAEGGTSYGNVMDGAHAASQDEAGNRRRQRRWVNKRKVAVLELVYILERNGLLPHKLRQQLLQQRQQQQQLAQCNGHRHGTAHSVTDRKDAALRDTHTAHHSGYAVSSSASSASAADLSPEVAAALRNMLVKREEHQQYRAQERADVMAAISQK